MHRNEKKLVSDLSSVIGFNIYTLAKDVFDLAGFSKEFAVKSITKDGSVSFGSSNMLHWNVLRGWVLHSEGCDPEFMHKIEDALAIKREELLETEGV